MYYLVVNIVCAKEKHSISSEPPSVPIKISSVCTSRIDAIDATMALRSRIRCSRDWLLMIISGIKCFVSLFIFAPFVKTRVKALIVLRLAILRVDTGLNMHAICHNFT